MVLAEEQVPEEPALDLEDPIGAQTLQGLRRGDSQLVEHMVGELGGDLAGPHEVGAAGLEDRAVEEPVGAREAKEGGAAHGAGRLAEDRDLVGVAAEGLDLVAYPGERGHLVEEALVAGGGEPLAEAVAQAKEAEGAEPVVDGDDHHVPPPGQGRAVIEHLGARAQQEGSAVDPHQDRPSPAVGRGRPDVQIEAVLAGAADAEAHDGPDERAVLRGRRPEERGVVRAGPRLGRLGWPEAPRPDRRAGVGDPAEYREAFLGQAAHTAPAGLDQDVHGLYTTSPHE